MLSTISQISSEGDLMGTLFQMAWLGFFFVMMFFGQKIQMYQIGIQLEQQILRLKALRNKTLKETIEYIKKKGKGKQVSKKIEDLFLEYVTIIPNSMDPAGVVEKVEHVFNVREYHWEEKVKDLAPKASEVQRKNIENVLEGIYAINLLYKMGRHYFLLGKKNKNYMLILQAQMIMPMIESFMLVFKKAIKAFMLGCPIGDGIGPWIVGVMMKGRKTIEIAKETVMATVPFKKRTLYLVKSKGPHGTVGNPDKAIEEVIKTKGKISMVIMIDAGLMAEGDTRGEILQGTGAAIGGFGNERFRIEEIVSKHKIPIYCWIVKESLKDAITAMNKELVDSVSTVVKSIENFIIEQTKEGEQILVVGIGNTMGVGQE